MKVRVRSPLFLDHRRGRRLSAGASPCRRIPRGGAEPSLACSMCGPSSTRVAASAFRAATDIMPHRTFPHADDPDLRSLGAASGPFALTRSRIKPQVAVLHRPPGTAEPIVTSWRAPRHATRDGGHCRNLVYSVPAAASRAEPAFLKASTQHLKKKK